MANSNEKIFTEKEMGFSQFDPMIFHLSGAQNDEKGIAIRLQFGSLVGAVRIFNGEIVKSELTLKTRQHFSTRLLQTNPDKLIGFLKNFADVFYFDIRYLASIPVCRAIHDSIVGVHGGCFSGPSNDN